MNIRGSIDAEMLNNMVLYVLGKDVERLTDSDIMQEINRRCTTVKNNHLPDVEALFAEKLRMDLKEDDIEARILKYFACFNNIGGNYQLQHVMGHTKANDHDAIVQTKNKTRIRIDNLAPTMLKREIMCLVALEYCKAKADEVALYNLILERAREQQDYFLTTIEDKQKQTTQSKAPISRKSHTQYVKGSMNGDSRARPSKQHPPKPATSTPPRDGFLECKGPHWVSECPKSSNAQKDEAKRSMRESMAARSSAKRSTLSSSQESQLSAVLAGNLEVPQCADLVSDVFIIPRSILLGFPSDWHATTTLRHPVSV